MTDTDFMGSDDLLTTTQALLVAHGASGPQGASGLTTTARIDDSGRCSDLVDTSIEPADLIVAIGGSRVVSRSSHTTSTSRFWVHTVRPDGTLITGPSSEWASVWTLVAPARDLLLGYHGFGYAWTARVDTEGHIRPLEMHFGWDPWDLISAVGNSQVLCYNRSSRTAALAAVDGAGGYADVASYTGFDAWTTIVASGVGPVLFYDFHSGRAATAVFDVNGQYTDLHSFALDPGWRKIVPIGEGHVLFHGGPGGPRASMGRIATDGTFHDGAFVEPTMDPWHVVTSVR